MNQPPPVPVSSRNAATRSTKPSDEGAFGWYSRDAVFVLQRHFAENSGSLSYGLALYFVLTDIASREHSAEITVAQRELACLSGMSVGKVKDCLRTLAAIGLVSWTHTFSEHRRDGAGIRDQGPNVYRLLSLNGRAA